MGWSEDMAGAGGASREAPVPGAWGGPAAGETEADMNFPAPSTLSPAVAAKPQPRELFQKFVVFKHWPCTGYLPRVGHIGKQRAGGPFPGAGLPRTWIQILPLGVLAV